MSERWDQVKEILALALEQESGERGSFIRKACGEDEGLRPRLSPWPRISTALTVCWKILPPLICSPFNLIASSENGWVRIV